MSGSRVAGIKVVVVCRADLGCPTEWPGISPCALLSANTLLSVPIELVLGVAPIL